MSGRDDTARMVSCKPSTRATSQVVAGRARAAYVAGRLGIGLREARLAAGLVQREVAARAGVSQPEIARLEGGHGSATGIDTWAACGAAVGLQLAAFFEAAPGAQAPRDIEHLKRQNLVIATAAAGGWHAEPEAPLPGDGPRPRSIDVLLTRSARREAAVVEVWACFWMAGPRCVGSRRRSSQPAGGSAWAGTSRASSWSAQRAETDA
jgi:transcriptional regulator with XRE-family HTH domain